MKNEELQQLVKEISLSYFNKPFLHKSYFNDRLRTTGGRYMLDTHHIEINRKYYHYFGKEELVAIIKHELCHYHLHLEGKGYRHRDKDFKELMSSVGAPRFCSALPQLKRSRSRKIVKYICSDCNSIYQRKRRINTDRYVCGKCQGRLRYMETIDTLTT